MGMGLERELNERMKANDDDIHMNVHTYVDMVGGCTWHMPTIVTLVVLQTRCRIILFSVHTVQIRTHSHTCTGAHKFCINHINALYSAIFSISVRKYPDTQKLYANERMRKYGIWNESCTTKPLQANAICTLCHRLFIVPSNLNCLFCVSAVVSFSCYL